MHSGLDRAAVAWTIIGWSHRDPQAADPRHTTHRGRVPGSPVTRSNVGIHRRGRSTHYRQVAYHPPGTDDTHEHGRSRAQRAEPHQSGSTHFCGLAMSRVTRSAASSSASAASDCTSREFRFAVYVASTCPRMTDRMSPAPTSTPADCNAVSRCSPTSAAAPGSVIVAIQQVIVA